MRFFIKAYCMHEEEVAALAAEKAAGAVDGDIHDGLVIGTADAEAIERLAARGIVVQALGPVPEGPAPGATTPEATPESAPGPGRAPGYWLAEIVAVSDETIDALAAAGAEIVERDPSGRFVLRASDGDALRRLPFVRDPQPYGVAETMQPAALSLSIAEEAADDAAPGTRRLAVRRAAPGGATLESAATADPVTAGRFEAICHEPAERDAVAAAIAALGGTIVLSAGRAVRFILNRADVASVAALPGVASVAAAQSARLRCDLARAVIGLERAGSGAGRPALRRQGRARRRRRHRPRREPSRLRRQAGHRRRARPARRRLRPRRPRHPCRRHHRRRRHRLRRGQRRSAASPGADLHFQSILDAQRRARRPAGRARRPVRTRPTTPACASTTTVGAPMARRARHHRSLDVDASSLPIPTC